MKLQQAFYFSKLNRVASLAHFIDAFGHYGKQEYEYFKQDGHIAEYLAKSFMGNERIEKLLKLMEDSLNPQCLKRA